MLDLAGAQSSLMLDAAALCVGAGSKAWWRPGPVRLAPPVVRVVDLAAPAPIPAQTPDNGLTVPDSAGTDQKISPQQILDNQARRYPNKRKRIPHDRR